LLPVDGAGLVTEEQGRVVNEVLDLHCVLLASRGDSPAGDAVVEIHQDFAQIKNDNFGFHHWRFEKNDDCDDVLLAAGVTAT
jgi:hypothetical protein